MKKLLQIPREISAKFCYGVEGMNHFEDKINTPKLNENKNPLSPKIEEKDYAGLEKQEATENLTKAENLKNILKEAGIGKAPDGLVEAGNRNNAVENDLKAEEFDYNNALKETENLLASLDQEIIERGFGPMNV